MNILNMIVPEINKYYLMVKAESSSSSAMVGFRIRFIFCSCKIRFTYRLKCFRLLENVVRKVLITHRTLII